MDETAFRLVDRPLELTKSQAALRQTEAAIAAFERGDYDIAITLAGAAEGMLLTNKDTDAFEVLIWLGGSALRKERVAYLNEHRDWLKHPTEHLQIDRTITAHDAAVMIFRAVMKIEDTPATLEPFAEWFADHVKQRYLKA